MAGFLRRWTVVTGTGLIVLAGFVTLPASRAPAQGPWPWALENELKPQVHKAGLFDWLLPKKGPAKQVPQQSPVTKPKSNSAVPGNSPQQSRPGQGRPNFAGGTYRTLCVRPCDGYYFPISFKATRSKFSDDNIACLQRCSGGKARLFVHRNPGQEVSGAIDLDGNRYVDLDNAFRYRKELVKGCGCEASLLAETGSDSQ